MTVLGNFESWHDKLTAYVFLLQVNSDEVKSAEGLIEYCQKLIADDMCHQMFT